MTNINGYGCQLGTSSASGATNKTEEKKLSDIEIKFDYNNNGKLENNELALYNKYKNGTLSGLGKSGKSVFSIEKGLDNIKSICEYNGTLSISLNNGNTIKISEGSKGKYEEMLSVDDKGRKVKLEGYSSSNNPNIEFPDRDNENTEFHALFADKLSITSGDTKPTNNTYSNYKADELQYDTEGTADVKDKLMTTHARKVNITTSMNRTVDMPGTMELGEMDSAILCADDNSKINARYTTRAKESDVPFWDFWGHTRNQNKNKLRSHGNVNLEES